ncbi:MAG: RnfABCDGE type electron transport complex subunit B [Ruminococcus sp.]|nr:RnfABCDGE type electron transport complex subunit B [Ruminococcus sp.]
MNETLFAVLIAVLVVAGIGLILGLVLAIASVVMAVPKDEKAEAVLEILPGANCGACGFSGCEGYAKAVAKGDAKAGLCPVGGEECTNAICELLGVSGETVKKHALVHCMGNCDNTENKAVFQGVNSCLAAHKIGGGVTACSYGCLGMGDCMNACLSDAITICNGVAVVDLDKCGGCGLCAEACPRKLITITTSNEQAVVRCSNHDKGAVAKKACKSACIGCMKCTKVCEEGAITVKDFCASIDPEKCTGCGACVENCPCKCITF